MVRHRFLVAAFVGSNPTTPAKFQMTDNVFFSLNDCTLKYGKEIIFDNISINLHKNDKVALVGKNGVGKSTLLKVIQGSKLSDSGEIWVNPKIKVGILSQNISLLKPTKVFDYLFNFLDSTNEEYFLKQICKQLKLKINDEINNLSGGEQRKLFLGALILKKPDLLLLDEPTNHLDINSINWLEDFLLNIFNGAFLVTSHNRNFLNKVTNKVFWIDRKKIRISPKGFKNFENWSNSLIEHEKRELENKKKFLSEEMEWISKGVTARRKRNIRRKENIFRFKAEYEKQRSEFLRSITKVKIDVSKNNEIGPNTLINFHKVRKKFCDDNNEKKILDVFSFKLLRGEKVGIIGGNGSGKSTFLKMINNNQLIDEGTIKIRKNLKIDYFDQSGSQLNHKKSIKENLIPGGGDYIQIADRKVHICGYLKNFLFDPKEIDQNVGFLSGGERSRLLLAKILSNPKDILLLDEPTNDLDLETIDVLIEFLKKFTGGVFIASHDLDFLNKTASRFLIFNGNGKVDYSDDLSKFLGVRQNNEEVQNKKTKVISEKELPLKSKNFEKEISKILKKIEKKERYILELSNQLEKINKDNDFNYLKSKKVLSEIKIEQNELIDLEKVWYDLEEQSLKDKVIK